MDPASARRLLGVDSGASRQQVDHAFRRLAARHHPDRGGDTGYFRQLVAARQALRRPVPGAAQGGLVVVVARHRRLLRSLRRLVERHVLHAERPPRVY